MKRIAKFAAALVATPFAVPIAAMIAFVHPVSHASSEQTIIGIAAPLTGPVARLGDQLQAGATVALRSAGALPVTVDDTCSREGGIDAAEKLVAANVVIVVGFLCMDAIEAALPILTNANIPVITPGVRIDSLTDRRAKTGWLVFRTAPRADAERKAIADILVRRWSDKLFAIVDDGTIYGRELAESFRLSAEQAGLKPVFTDTYRPQFNNQIGLAGRLKSAGATHVFAGGNRDDIAILARDAAVIGYPLTIAGGEALRAAPADVDLAPGTLMIGMPEPRDVATTAFLQTFEQAGIAAEGYVLGGYTNAEIALRALDIHKKTGAPLTDVLSREQFETATGTIRFDTRGDRVKNPFRLFRYDGERFVEVR